MNLMQLCLEDIYEVYKSVRHKLLKLHCLSFVVGANFIAFILGIVWHFVPLGKDALIT